MTILLTFLKLRYYIKIISNLIFLNIKLIIIYYYYFYYYYLMCIMNIIHINLRIIFYFYKMISILR